jgi:hypothetical protein
MTPKWMTIIEYAAHRKAVGLSGGTRQAVDKAIASGRISLIEGRIDPAVADIQWERNTQRRVDLHATAPTVQVEASTSSATDAAAADPSWAESKARTEAAVAQLKEMQVAKMRGELVDRSGVERGSYQTGRQIQKALVDVFPARIAVEGVTFTEPWPFECWLRDQVRAELRALSNEFCRMEESE